MGEITMYWIGGFLVVFFVIPNTTNFKERRAFYDELRLEHAMSLYHVDKVTDSVTVVPGKYYNRDGLGVLFLGEKQRGLWTTPVRVKVFSYNKTKGGLTPIEFGGGQQTISIKLQDGRGRKWALRSVNKDQQSVLPKALRITFLRFVARDQLASANPYAHLPIPVLANTIGIHHTTPELVLVPYDKKEGRYNDRMAGRLAYLEEDLNSSWKNRERFGSPADILNTEEMRQLRQKENIPIDTMLYLKTRLFDMLICDWDRHEGNWEWALTKEGGAKIFEPIPKDRDNAFYQFDEGLISHIILLFSPKFQSFRKKFGNVAGLMQQARHLDMSILSSVERRDFERTAREIQKVLTDQIITEAFRRYPPNIYEMKGKDHEDILKARLEQLPDAANQFYELLHKNGSGSPPATNEKALVKK
jgi:hypothetical protein